ncbi:N-(5'-phosphoribosyl)anthranilate isomerase [uncultured Tateyamaria sp.]|uniref:N-(5'-phosphoribosyl)anthranilate isomerase n=1 Tax=uncultured Tateyamaria sp. TaxID=455651 RepID=UPI00263909B2|nr:N-(5'-phosphoribosyl)anthranilate isomerase [uncultured Tateyamaria sp.]
MNGYGMYLAQRAPPNDAWIDQLFSSKAARKGAVVRRSLAWVHREVGRAEFEAEVRKRGYHLIETADQLVVVCHNGPIRLLF